MDIAQIQRTNQMAKDLFDRGIASSLEEGMRIADNIVSRGGEGIPQATGPAGATPVQPFTVSLNGARISAPSSMGSSTGSYGAAPMGSMPNGAGTTNAHDLDLQIRTLNFRLNEQANHLRQLQEKMAQLDLALMKAHTAPHAQPRVISEPAPSGQTHLVHEVPTAQKMVTIVNASTGEAVHVSEVNSTNGESTAKRLHARVGAYTSDDVSVEKMFYCGGK